MASPKSAHHSGLAITVRFTVVPRIEDDAWRRFVRDLTHFEMAQYVAWASADVVILSGVDVGYGMRLVPNLMYYAAFVPFLWWRRPPEAQA